MVSRLSILFSGGMLWEEYLDMPVIGVKHPLLGAQLLWILDYPPIKRGKHNWLVVWNLAFMTFHILGTIIPTDFHIFQRGWYTTNQIKIPNRNGGVFTGKYTTAPRGDACEVCKPPWSAAGLGRGRWLDETMGKPWGFPIRMIPSGYDIHSSPWSSHGPNRNRWFTY